MAAYAIADIEITDPEAFEQYRAEVPATIEAYGGRFLVRGAEGEVAEGDWAPNRVVVLEFESMERLKAWYNSPEYTPLKELRMRASNGNVVLAEGV